MSSHTFIPEHLLWDADLSGSIGSATGSSLLRPLNIYMGGYIEMREISAPSAANTGTNRLYFNSTDHLLHYVNHSGVDSSIGGATFPLLASPIGSASAPAYSFLGNSNTGAYSPSGNKYAIATAGVQRALFSDMTSSGDSFFSVSGTPPNSAGTWNGQSIVVLQPGTSYTQINGLYVDMQRNSIAANGNSFYAGNFHLNYNANGFNIWSGPINAAVLGDYSSTSSDGYGAGVLGFGPHNGSYSLGIVGICDTAGGGGATQRYVGSAGIIQRINAGTNGVKFVGAWGVLANTNDAVPSGSGALVGENTVSGNNIALLSLYKVGNLSYQIDVNGVMIQKQASTPSAPGSGYNALYFKSDGNLYMQNSSAVETQVNSSGTSFPLLAPNGSVSAPSYSFSSSTSTGVYSPATNQVGFSTNGVQAGYFDASQNLVVSGSVSAGGSGANSVTMTQSSGNIANFSSGSNNYYYNFNMGGGGGLAVQMIAGGAIKLSNNYANNAGTGIFFSVDGATHPYYSVGYFQGSWLRPYGVFASSRLGIGNNTANTQAGGGALFIKPPASLSTQQTTTANASLTITLAGGVNLDVAVPQIVGIGDYIQLTGLSTIARVLTTSYTGSFTGSFTVDTALGDGTSRGINVLLGIASWQNTSGTEVLLADYNGNFTFTPPTSLKLASGQFLAPNGSASTPSYSFTSATGMGFYTVSSSPNRLGLAIAGSLAVEFQAAEIDWQGQTHYLDVAGSNSISASGANFAMNTGGIFQLSTSGLQLQIRTNQLRIAGSGGDLLWETDGSNNIGATGGANRPNNLYLKTGILIRHDTSTTQGTELDYNGLAFWANGFNAYMNVLQVGSNPDLQFGNSSNGTLLKLDGGNGSLTFLNSSGSLLWSTNAGGSVGSSTIRPDQLYVQNTVHFGLNGANMGFDFINNSTSAQLGFRDTGSNEWYIYTLHNGTEMRFQAQGTETISFTNSGGITLKQSSNANIIWSTDGSGNLGAVGATRPNNIYAKAIIVAGDISTANSTVPGISLNNWSSVGTQIVLKPGLSGSNTGGSYIYTDTLNTLFMGTYSFLPILQLGGSNPEVFMGGSSNANLKWSTDGAGTIGAAGATRPDKGYFKTQLVIGTDPATSSGTGTAIDNISVQFKKTGGTKQIGLQAAPDALSIGFNQTDAGVIFLVNSVGQTQIGISSGTTSHLVWQVDGGGDIGTTGALRPRSAYLTTSANIEGGSASLTFGLSGSSQIKFAKSGTQLNLTIQDNGHSFFFADTGTGQGQFQTDALVLKGNAGSFTNGAYILWQNDGGGDIGSASNYRPANLFLTGFEQLTEIATPSNPPAGTQILYINSSDHKLHRLDSSGTDTVIG